VERAFLKNPRPSGTSLKSPDCGQLPELRPIAGTGCE
jgi:hypothetical protein